MEELGYECPECGTWFDDDIESCPKCDETIVDASQPSLSRTIEPVHVYRTTQSYSDGLVFVRATPDEIDYDTLAHLGTLDEFTRRVKADTGEFGGYIWDAEHAYWHEG
ncbi:hypothetical protein [Halostella litorea]|uniref:hypothetical protein n=1 Tax=Halostella litorea TaxID=2528831 RepID=UPI001092E2C2|nr:hypothetical protein [Halostella litorea]